MGGRKPSRRGALVAGALIGLLGWIGLGNYALKTKKEWDVKRTWREVPCEIVKAEPEQLRRNHRRTRYKPIVEYRYEIDGRGFTSTTYAPNHASYRGGEIGDVLEPLKPGSKHTCYVDPADPTRAVLVARDFPFPIGLGVSAAFAGIGGAIAWLSRKIE